MADIYGDIIREQNEHKKRIKRLEEVESPRGVYVPLATPATSTSWDGDAKYDTHNGVIDLSVVFGLPANIKSISATLQIACATVGKTVTCGATVAYRYQLPQETQVTNAVISNSGDVTCDANGDIYFWTDAVVGAQASVWLTIYGYYI